MEMAVQLSPAEYRRVLAFFEKAAAEEPTKWSYWCDIGFCRGKLGQWQEAATAFERIVDKIEVTASVLSMLAHAYIKLDRYHEAAIILDKACALAPDNLSVLYKMAMVHFHCGKNRMALKPLQQIIGQRPEYVKAHFTLGLVFHRLGNQEKAERQIDIVRTLDQNLAERLARMVHRS